MQQNMQHLFAQIPRADIQRSVFDRSHTLKTAFDSGYLVPIYVDEALPGDTFRMDLSLFGRLSTMVVPVMDNIYLETFFFAVPNRLVWSNWQKFCGEQEDPGDSTDYLVPRLQYTTDATAVGSIHDYLGIPPGRAYGTCSCLWHRAYNLIWNEWFRDENLQDSVTVPKDDGPDSPALYTLLRRGKRHDYFTSCLPWPQKGPGVGINLAGTAPVWGDGNAMTWQSGLPSNGTSGSPYGRALFTTFREAVSNDAVSAVKFGSSASTDGGLNIIGKGLGNSHVYADLSAASAVTINDLRTAFQIQRLYEADARGGTRYTEILRQHFGVISPDARLQRPEYLGGSSCRINVHPVSQQSATDTVTPQGNLAAFATAGDVQHVFEKSFTEHTLIIGLACVRADLTYQQGINRMFTRRTRFDYYWPTLAHLGEQAVLNREIYLTGDDNGENTDPLDTRVFGYQERWAEYRYKPSMITGKLRSGVTGSLDVWHLAQNFPGVPSLSDAFIQENPPLSRVVAVTNEPQIILDVDFGLKCARPMPVYSVPGLIDHF